MNARRSGEISALYNYRTRLRTAGPSSKLVTTADRKPKRKDGEGRQEWSRGVDGVDVRSICVLLLRLERAAVYRAADWLWASDVPAARGKT